MMRRWAYGISRNNGSVIAENGGQDDKAPGSASSRPARRGGAYRHVQAS